MDSSVQREASAPMWTRFATVGAVVAAWLLVRPYGGIRHDARLYFAQALFGDDAAFVANDLLIANDQQMQFSVYGRLIDLGLRWLEPGSVALVLTAFGLVAWILAASLLGRTLTRRWWWLIALAIPLAGTSYGPHGIFLFAEGYATPRSIAEALAVAAIACALREKVWLALGLAALGGLAHPLVAISGLIAVVCIAAVRDRRWLIFIVAALPIAVLTVWVDPLNVGGAEAFDTMWLMVIEDRSPQVFLRTWDSRGWELVVTALILLSALALRTSLDRLRSFSIGLLGAGAIGLVGTWILADLLGSVLGTQLQLWRTVWLAQLGVGVAVGFALVELLDRRTVAAGVRALLVVFVASLPFVLDGAGFFAVAAVLGLLLLLPMPDLSPRLKRLVAVLLGGIVAGLVTIQVSSLLTSADIATTPRALLWSTLPSIMPIVTVGVGLLIAGVVLAGMRGPVAAVASSLVIAMLVAGTVWTWDARSDWLKFAEGSEQPVLVAAPDAVVLVEIDSLGFYTLLARPVYFNAVLGAGVVFSRDLALEYESHRANAELIDFTGSDKRIIQRRGTQDLPTRTFDDLVSFCERPGAPSTLLLRIAAADAPGIEWVPPYVPDGAARLNDEGVSPSDRLFRYECSEILLSNPSSG